MVNEILKSIKLSSIFKPNHQRNIDIAYTLPLSIQRGILPEMYRISGTVSKKLRSTHFL